MREQLNQRYIEEISSFNANLTALQEIAKIVKHDEMKNVVDNLIKNSENAFLFVVVGEVKAGKSSFVNALLDANKEICKVAASPMTDTIQLITYGETENIININDYQKRIEINADILKDITIVDTPGTNSIIKHHQEITEKFIPYADLIVFVFEAKNPYRQSAWEFLDYINTEWRRKIIFVLQQKDLANQEDLETNINGLREFAITKSITEPSIFAVSALQEQKGQKSESGYLELRKWIEQNITNGNTPMLKLKNMIDTSIRINSTLSDSLDIRKKQLEADVAFRKDIQDTLDYQEVKTNKQIDTLSSNVLDTYDLIMNTKINDISRGLSFTSVIKRSISSLFGGEYNLKEWLNNQVKDLENQFNIKLKGKVQEGIVDVADSIQIMGKLVDSKIRNSQTILKHNDEIFSDIADKRSNVLKDLQQSFNSFLSNTENFYDPSMLEESNKLAPNVLTGGGIAVVGVVLATVINGAVFDITGGILTTIGVLFAGVSLGLQKSKIMKKLKTEAQLGRATMDNKLNNILVNYTKAIKKKIDQNFIAFDGMIESEKNTIARIDGLQDDFLQKVNDQLKRIA